MRHLRVEISDIEVVPEVVPIDLLPIYPVQHQVLDQFPVFPPF